jgi:TorA maturation chaperone TorD
VESAALVRLLALALAPPTEATLAETAALAAALAELPEMPDGLRELAAAASGAPAEAVAAAHERVFAPDPIASPYEASTTVDPFAQARLQADVAGFYAAFGAAAHGAAAERPDHAGTELEFLAFLALKRLQSADEGHAEEAERCATVEAAFLGDHAGRWLVPFFRRLAARADDPFHRALGRLGTVVVGRELSLRGLDVVEVEAPRGTRHDVEGDELACGADGSTPSFVDELARPHRQTVSTPVRDGRAVRPDRHSAAHEAQGGSDQKV